MNDKEREEMEERFREVSEGIADGARKLGLYAEEIGVIMAPPGHFEEPTPILVANFNIGEQAWSARVQDPEQDRIETEFKLMERDMTKTEFEELRQRLAREHGQETEETE